MSEDRRHFPPRLAGFLRNLLTTRWAVGAVAVIFDEGAWGLPGGSLESGPFVSALLT